MAEKRITEVDFIDSLQSDESFFVNQNNAIKQINKGNIIFEIVNGGTGANNVIDARMNLDAAALEHEHNVGDITDFLEHVYDATDSRVANTVLAAPDNSNGVASFRKLVVSDLPMMTMEKGGTNASDGATGLSNLFAAGATVLSAYQYGDELPEAGIVGRMFYKKVNL